MKESSINDLGRFGSQEPCIDKENVCNNTILQRKWWDIIQLKNLIDPKQIKNILNLKNRLFSNTIFNIFFFFNSAQIRRFCRHQDWPD